MMIEDFVLKIIGDLRKDKETFGGRVGGERRLWAAIRRIETHCKLISDTRKELERNPGGRK